MVRVQTHLIDAAQTGRRGPGGETVGVRSLGAIHGPARPLASRSGATPQGLERRLDCPSSALLHAEPARSLGDGKVARLASIARRAKD